MAKRPRISIKIASTDGLYPAILSALSTAHLSTLETYLQDAINSEQYEFAADIRDRIKEITGRNSPDIETIEAPY